MDTIVPILVALVLAWVVYLMVRPNYDFEIVVAGERVDLRGRIPLGKHQAIANFVRQDFPDVKRARVSGKWEGNRLRLRCQGDLATHQQRVRNFLIDTL